MGIERKMMADDTWKRIESLRKTEHPEIIEWYENGRMEILNVKYVDETGFFFRPQKSRYVNHEEIQEYDTILGRFISYDRGEFGGSLFTPIGEIQGNFCELFECNGKVYAVDSLHHMTLMRTNIYEFSNVGGIKRIFGTEDMCFSCYKMTADGTYFLLYGEKSLIIRVDREGNVEQVDEIPCGMYGAKSMVISKNKIVIGGNRLVAVVDITNPQETKSYFFTTLNKKDEEILLLRRNLYFGKKK